MYNFNNKIFEWKMKLFLLFNSPILFFLSPKIVRLDNESLVIKISKNRYIAKNLIPSPNFGSIMMAAEFTSNLIPISNIVTGKNRDWYVPLLRNAEIIDAMKAIQGDIHMESNVREWDFMNDPNSTIKQKEVIVKVYYCYEQSKFYRIKFCFSLKKRTA